MGIIQQTGYLQIICLERIEGHPLVGFCQAQKTSLARKKRFFFVLSFLMITGILD
jgi:hypothetical protein